MPRKNKPSRATSPKQTRTDPYAFGGELAYAPSLIFHLTDVADEVTATDLRTAGALLSAARFVKESQRIYQRDFMIQNPDGPTSDGDDGDDASATATQPPAARTVEKCPKTQKRHRYDPATGTCACGAQKRGTTAPPADDWQTTIAPVVPA